MNDWAEYQLGELVEYMVDNRGKTPPLSESGHELLEVNAILQNKKYPEYSNVRKYVSKDTFENWFRSGHPESGDILIPTVGTIGNVAILKEKRGAIAQNLIALRMKHGFSSEYIYYFLQSPLGKNLMLSLDIGGVQPSIKVPHLLGLTILIPAKNEQEAITAVLASLDDKIDLLYRQNKTLESLAQTLFRHWFMEGTAVDWEVRRLKDICEIKNGYAFKSETYQDEGYKIIRTLNFENNLVTLNKLTPHSAVKK